MSQRTLLVCLALVGMVGCGYRLGGVGEHVPAVRKRILTDMGWAGIEIDSAANDAARGQEARIDTSRQPVRVHVIPAEEEGVLARAALGLITE